MSCFRLYIGVVSPSTCHLIDSILEKKHIDLPYIIFYVFLRASIADHSTGSLPFPVLKSQILKTHKVPLQSSVRAHRISALGLNTL